MVDDGKSMQNRWMTHGGQTWDQDGRPGRQVDPWAGAGGSVHRRFAVYPSQPGDVNHHKYSVRSSKDDKSKSYLASDEFTDFCSVSTPQLVLTVKSLKKTWTWIRCRKPMNPLER